jgi:hypothetical protein
MIAVPCVIVFQLQVNINTLCKSFAPVQIYPENATQAEMMVAAAMKVRTCTRHA